MDGWMGAGCVAGSWSARVIGALMMAAILTNCASFVLGSMQKYRSDAQTMQHSQAGLLTH